ncbi:isochorismate synthase [Metabacillus malikii]|uniref:Isochorismate synthase MenF n=1 Tax=Metabacillus malikii TaxID=1504265 RepID=A0ABT9ZFN3_9BACI|nr:isochorismate synthase [Metabacillus malikii]MDQ0231103.1 menaquinone-specific isochorismate synthase [Metabacillus malikii]
MLTTLDNTMKENIVHALEKARQTNQSVIVSTVREVDAINPLHFYATAEKLNIGERFFWSSPSEHFTLVGVGNELILENEDNDERFQKIESQWREYPKRLIAAKHEIGTGPLLFGGFSFDPIKEKDLLWETFSEAKFVLPTKMLTVRQNKTYLTINKLITPFDDSGTCLQHFESSNENIEKYKYNLDCEKGNEFASIELKTAEWVEAVQQATDDIKANQLDKVVLAREVHLEFSETINPYHVIGRLQTEQPTSFIFCFENGPKQFIGATPERLVKKQENQVLSTCLAGSINRGSNKQEDEMLGNKLLHDEKNLLEHHIVVKMIREALEYCCNDLNVPTNPILLKTKNIQHLYTPVRGLAKDGYSLLDMVAKLHPTPALGGYPKQKAVEKIRELEPMHRGWYAAPIGWFDHEDNGEFVVAIRSGLIEDNKAALFAGCGIVSESDPETEYLETKMKLKPMMSALGGKEYEGC